MNVCLDAFALLAWLQNEQGSSIVDGLLAGAKRNEHQCFMSAINLGEVYYRLVRLKGQGNADSFWEDVRAGQLPLSVVEVSRSRIQQAALLKGRYPIAYADAFAAQAAIEKDVPLVTGDPELRALEAVGLTIQWIVGP